MRWRGLHRGEDRMSTSPPERYVDAFLDARRLTGTLRNSPSTEGALASGRATISGPAGVFASLRNYENIGPMCRIMALNAQTRHN